MMMCRDIDRRERTRELDLIQTELISLVGNEDFAYWLVDLVEQVQELQAENRKIRQWMSGR